jgi:hypothetical protein
MIIQINATVCAALDHGQGRQLKIAGRDLQRMMQGRSGKGIYQAGRKLKERSGNVGSCSRCRMAKL